MSAEIGRLRGRIEALELISIAAMAKLASQDERMRRDTAEEIRYIAKFGVTGLSSVALSGFREVLGRVLGHLEPQGLK